MRIRYRRSGGIANIVREVEVDSEQLPHKLQNVLRTLESSGPLEPARSDDFYHELEFEDGRKIRCTDSLCPPDVLELFDYLAQS
ncbi:hypothetical protein L0222_07365 [bacterium]|nr:hypothetical protein [bacterium]MCI0603116.1 hypothetical protein [bacterium]